MEYLNRWILNGLDNALNRTGNTINDVSQSISMSPDAFNPTIYNAVKTISENAVLPIAYMLLGMFAMIELWEMAQKHNGGHEILPQQLAFVLMKVAVGKYFLEYTFLLLGSILGLVNSIISNASSSILGFSNVTIDVDDFASTVENMGFLEKFGTWLGLFPNFLIIKIMGAFITILIFGRFIELYLYTAVAPIPISMLINSSLSNTGKNFLKNFAAVALQGVFIIIIVGIYGVLINNTVQGGDIDEAVGQSIIYGGVLIFALAKSGGWARNVIGG